jgi:hypothetical protein
MGDPQVGLDPGHHVGVDVGLDLAELGRVHAERVVPGAAGLVRDHHDGRQPAVPGGLGVQGVGDIGDVGRARLAHHQHQDGQAGRVLDERRGGQVDTRGPRHEPRDRTGDGEGHPAPLPRHARRWGPVAGEPVDRGRVVPLGRRQVLHRDDLGDRLVEQLAEAVHDPVRRVHAHGRDREHGRYDEHGGRLAPPAGPAQVGQRQADDHAEQHHPGAAAPRQAAGDLVQPVVEDQDQRRGPEGAERGGKEGPPPPVRRSVGPAPQQQHEDREQDDAVAGQLRLGPHDLPAQDLQDERVLPEPVDRRVPGHDGASVVARDAFAWRAASD